MKVRTVGLKWRSLRVNESVESVLCTGTGLTITVNGKLLAQES